MLGKHLHYFQNSIYCFPDFFLKPSKAFDWMKIDEL